LGSELEKCVGSRVHLVGVSISFETNVYRLPFTPPPLWFAVSVLHIVESLLVNVRGSYVFDDFVVLDRQEEIPLILGRPFLRDVNARMDVRAGKIQFRIV
jgi:hypothetical protein